MIRFFAAHPTAANLLMLALIAAGLLSIGDLRRETFPHFSAEQVEIRVVYPGATAIEVEDAVCRRIEDVLDGIDFMDEVRAEAREGIAIVVAEMTSGGSFQVFFDDIRTQVDSIDDFPALVESPIIVERGRTDPVISIAVTADTSPSDLKAYCEELEDRLRRDAGISLVEIQGFSDHQLRIELSEPALLKYGLSAAKVAEIVARQSIDFPAGTLETSRRDILLRFADERRTPHDLGRLVVVGDPAGGEIRLEDIAKITDVFEREEEKIVINGRRAGVLAISKTRTDDTLVISDAVKEFVAREEERKPPGVEFVLTQDVSSVVRDRLQMLLRNGWQGLLLVFLTLAVFFNLRLSFWVTMGLPVSFLGAFYVLGALGQSINMISMVALLMALGLLMDDAIVLAENIATHRLRGKKALAAVVAGVAEVRNGVLSSFATTVCIFAPLSFVTGQMGRVLRVMPVVLILVLATSLIEAFLILPHHLHHTIERMDPKRPSRFRRAFDRGLDWTRERLLGPTVDFVVRWRYACVGGVIGLFLISFAQIAGGILKTAAFPEIDGDVIEARVLLPQGTPLARTEEVTARLIRALETVDAEFTPLQPEGRKLIRNLYVSFNHNPDAFEQGPHVATVLADLLPAEERDARIDDIFARWREVAGDIPDVLALVFTEPSFGPAGRPIEIRLIGDDLVDLETASVELQAWLTGFDGVVDVSDDLRPGKPEVRLRLIEGATGLGITAADLAFQLRSSFFGATALEIQKGRESYEIDVRFGPDGKNSLADLDDFRVVLPGGGMVPLPTVAAMEPGRGYARVAHVDGRRTVTVRGDVDRSLVNARELLDEFKRDFLPGFAERHPDVGVTLEGEARESKTTQASLGSALLVGLIGIFILLSFQFRSYVEPLIVMVAIPMSLIGVIWGHILLGLDLTMPSIFGFASLAGVVVNDSILLVAFARRRRGEGKTPADAARDASRLRYRAVLLTSLTTVAGLLPLLAEKSLQAQILIPLATSIVFGLIASTVLVLLVVPALYAILGDLGLIARLEPAQGE